MWEVYKLVIDYGYLPMHEAMVCTKNSKVDTLKLHFITKYDFYDFFLLLDFFMFKGTLFNFRNL